MSTESNLELGNGKVGILIVPSLYARQISLLGMDPGTKSRKVVNLVQFPPAVEGLISSILEAASARRCNVENGFRGRQITDFSVDGDITVAIKVS